MFKIKRIENEDENLQVLSSEVTETDINIGTTLPPLKSNGFHSIGIDTRRNFFSESPQRVLNNSSMMNSLAKSKSIERSKSKVQQNSIPYIVKRHAQPAKRKRIDNSRNKNDIVNCFSLVDKLIKQNKVFV